MVPMPFAALLGGFFGNIMRGIFGGVARMFGGQRSGGTAAPGQKLLALQSEVAMQIATAHFSILILASQLKKERGAGPLVLAPRRGPGACLLAPKKERKNERKKETGSLRGGGGGAFAE